MLEPSGTHPGGEHHGIRTDAPATDPGVDTDHDHPGLLEPSMTSPTPAFGSAAQDAVKEA
jgi:hypothetical protein